MAASASICCRTASRSGRRGSGSSSRWRSSLADRWPRASSALVHVHPRRADREPEEPQQPAQDRDREARRADQGDRQAARADPGGARAQAGRRDAAGQPQRGRPPARPAGAPAAGRHLPAQSMKQIGTEGHARRLRAVERPRVDADAQHRGSPWLAQPGARRDQAGAVARRADGPASSRSTSSRSTLRSSSAAPPEEPKARRPAARARARGAGAPAAPAAARQTKARKTV